MPLRVSQYKDPYLQPQDILPRIPYGLQVRFSGSVYKVIGYIASGDKLILCDPEKEDCELIVEMKNVKPLLRKMNDMSLEERLKFTSMLDDISNNQTRVWRVLRVTEWLNSKMLDYRYLIRDGLAEERKP